MKLLSLGSFKDNPAEPSSHSWPWPPYCHQPRTLSFRYSGGGGGVSSASTPQPSESPRTRQLEAEDDGDDNSGLSLDDDAAIETAVTAARSERRLFFKPEETSSILARGESRATPHAPFIEESVAVSMDSRDPYMDFRRSMGEMVAAHSSLKAKSDRLEELLCWYLKANDRANHGYIFAAFVDLLVTTVQDSGGDCSSSSSAAPPPCNIMLTQSPSSPLSFYTSTSTSNSCCSSSTSSSTPCHVSAAESTEESSSESTVVAAPPSLLTLNLAQPIADNTSSLSSSSSLDNVSD